MVSYLAFITRALGDTPSVYGDPLVLASLRLLQDCPENAITVRRVGCFLVFSFLVPEIQNLGTMDRFTAFDWHAT
jgi:hypothetical protein